MAKGPGGIISGGFDPLNAPDAPTIDSVSAGVLTADVTFSAPADTGAGTVDSYVITAKQSDGVGVSATASAAGTASLTLTAGGTTTFAAQAISNAFGPGAFSGFGNSTSVFIGQELYGWGANTALIGDNTRINKSSPVQVGALTNWSQVSAGGTQSLAVKTDGTLWAWGHTDVGQVGDNTEHFELWRSSPIQIGALTDWSSVGAGNKTSFAITTSGELYAWGENDFGQLGLGDRTNRSSPVQVGALTNWSQVSSGDDHCLAIKTDGTLWAWGDGQDEGVGDGTGLRRSSPVQIGSDTDWAKISTISVSSFGLKTDGTLYAWGPNGSGQLGLDNRISKLSPTEVTLAPAFSEISAGLNSVMGVTTSNQLWAWGDGGNGRTALNIDQTIDRSSPVQVGALTNWSKLGNGFITGFGIKTDGTLWGWGGTSSQGRVGDGVNIDRSSPVQIGSETSWTSVSAFNHALATFGTSS